MKKANKQMLELWAGFAADLLAQGHSCIVVTTRVTEEYELREGKLEESQPRQWI